jgi:hypothetical protein
MKLGAIELLNLLIPLAVASISRRRCPSKACSDIQLK